MEHLIDNQIHYTPPEQYLYPFPQLNCTVAGCNAVFTNSSNLAMHLQKRHKVLSSNGESKTANKLFHCPHKSCIYNISQQDGKHFTCLKYLRQHFQKVHAVKNYSCDKCSMAFGTQGSLKSHQIHRCGKVFECEQCGLQFAQREALLMHAKRKGHAASVKTENNSNGRSKIKKVSSKTRIKSGNQYTQTEEKSLKAAIAQTDGTYYDIDRTKNTFVNGNFLNQSSEGVNDKYSLKQIDFASLYCDIETQTDISCSSNIPCSSNVTPVLDQMLSHSSHMHTQTCDDFLTELGLADIQTQTNWSNLNIESSNDAAILSNDLHGHDHSHDELFVSTETQTSFTQCLLDSNAESAFNSLCNTQHTQTCDTLLGSLFGGQESDFIGTLQSTYTQT